MSRGLDQALEADDWLALMGSKRKHIRPVRAWRVTREGHVAVKSLANPGFECFAATITLANDLLTKHENERAA